MDGFQAPQAGVFGTDYLFRAADTQYGFGANIAQEAFYPLTFTDSQGILLAATAVI